MKQKTNGKNADKKQNSIQATQKQRKTKKLLYRNKLKIECKKNVTPTPYQEDRQQLKQKEARKT